MNSFHCALPNGWFQLEVCLAFAFQLQRFFILPLGAGCLPHVGGPCRPRTPAMQGTSARCAGPVWGEQGSQCFPMLLMFPFWLPVQYELPAAGRSPERLQTCPILWGLLLEAPPFSPECRGPCRRKGYVGGLVLTGTCSPEENAWPGPGPKSSKKSKPPILAAEGHFAGTPEGGSNGRVSIPAGMDLVLSLGRGDLR